MLAAGLHVWLLCLINAFQTLQTWSLSRCCSKEVPGLPGMRGRIGNTVSIGKGLANMYSSLTRACISIGLLQLGVRWEMKPYKVLSKKCVVIMARFPVAATIAVKGSSMRASMRATLLNYMQQVSTLAMQTARYLIIVSTPLQCTGEGHSTMQKKAGCPLPDKQVHVSKETAELPH